MTTADSPDAPERDGKPHDASAPAPAPIAEIQPALALFERGDFRDARTQLQALLATANRPEVTAAAQDLLARMAPDPWALRLGILAAAVLVLVTVVYLF